MSVEQMLQAADAFARTVVAEAAGGEVVGAHLRSEIDADGQVSHVFEALQPGYRGWTWVVTLSAADAGAAPTVNDLVLLPGAEAIVAPAWTPYRDRVRPGDLGPGDVLPPDADDLRLAPAWATGDDDTESADRQAAKDLAGGRTWVLSLEGRDMAAQRWHDGDGGPHNALTQQASGTCRSCGFRIGLAGPLADRFGVCANGMANDDGRVVDFQHGCGAHSGVKLGRQAATQALPDPYLDTLTRDAMVLPPRAVVEDEVAPPAAESVVEESSDEVVTVDEAAEPDAVVEPVADVAVSAEPATAEPSDEDSVEQDSADQGSADQGQAELPLTEAHDASDATQA